MNAYRNLSKNNSALNKNLEKLSSGYRVNRSADDAAGLAISEKMRSLIRGIESAYKNCQDATSLVQTAEGALQEVHDMLQRMNGLALQSANGTYSDAKDRDALQQEFQQLQDEIDRIGASTAFNGMKLFDGSGGTGGASASIINLASLPANGNIVIKQDGYTIQGTLADLTVEINSANVMIDISNIDSTTLTLKVLNGNKANIRVGGSSTIETINVTGDVNLTGSGTLNFNTVNISSGANSLIVNGRGLLLNAVWLDNNGKMEVKPNNTVQSGTIRNKGTITNGGTMDINTLTNTLKGSNITNNGTIYYKGQMNNSGNITNNGTIYNEASIINYPGGTIVNNGTFINGDKVTGDALNVNGAVVGSVPPRPSGTKRGSTNPSSGDNIWIMQIGPESSDQMKIDIGLMNTTVLNIDRDMVNVATQDAASDAAEVVKDAINDISTQRARLGACQNRLQHTMNNLSVTRENIQNAESKIRDTDMAEEMMGYTKNNILIQSAQSMLAQTNVVPEMVLALL